MGPVTLREREGGRKVLGHDGVSVLDRREHVLVKSLLVSNLTLSERGLVSGVSEERGLRLHLGSLLTTEVCIVQLVVNLDVADVELRARSNDVCLVHAADRHTVQLERTSNKKETALELLEENNALATEATGQQNQNSTGRNAVTKLRGLGSLAAHLLSTNVVCRVETRRLVHREHTLTSVLCTTDNLLLGRDGLLLDRGGGLTARVLVATLLREQLAAAETTNVRADSAVAGHGTLQGLVCLFSQKRNPHTRARNRATS